MEKWNFGNLSVLPVLPWFSCPPKTGSCKSCRFCEALMETRRVFSAQPATQLVVPPASPPAPAIELTLMPESRPVARAQLHSSAPASRGARTAAESRFSGRVVC